MTSGLRNAFQVKPQCFWAAVLHKGILREAFVIHKSNGNPLRRVDQDQRKTIMIKIITSTTTLSEAMERR